MQRTPKWILRFLKWHSEKWGYLMLTVYFFSFVFVLLFGNYPQWQYENDLNEINQYFRESDKNIEVVHFGESKNTFKLRIRFSDGSDLDYEQLRPNKEQLKSAYKAELLEKVCLSEELTNILHRGQKVEIDFIDGDRPQSVAQLFNMRIDYDRCHTEQNNVVQPASELGTSARWLALRESIASKSAPHMLNAS